MVKLTDRQKLRLIDGLCLLYEDGSKTHTRAEKMLEDIYMVAHPHDGCPHPAWEKNAVKMAKGLKGYVDVFNVKETKLANKTITFDRSALKFLCKALHIPYNRNIIAFTKDGPVTNLFDLVDKKESHENIHKVS